MVFFPYKMQEAISQTSATACTQMEPNSIDNETSCSGDGKEKNESYGTAQLMAKFSLAKLG